MIEIQGLTKRYGKIIAVNNLSFTVNKGEILGFLGPNGAGKSTTMNILTGFIPATEGVIKVCGYDLMENPIEVKKRIGYLPEIPPLYLDSTVIEYLEFVSELKLVNKKERKQQIADIMEIVKITDVKNRLIKNLSKGYKQRVGLAQALIGKPDVIILDEPTVGLDPKQITEIRKVIKDLSREHTVVLSSHILPEVSAVCDRVVIINKGEIVAEDTPGNLSKIFEKESKLVVKIEGSKEMTLEALKSIEGVIRVEVIDEDDKSLTTYVVESDKEVDLRRQIYFTMASIGHSILEMKTQGLTLEDIFLQLTTEEKEEEI